MSLLSGQLYNVPDVPHAFDEEFEGDTLDPKWIIDGNLVASPVALDAAETGNNLRISVGQRKSWLRLQAGPSTSTIATSVGIRWAPEPGVELPNGFYWCRYAPRWRRPAQVANDCTSYLVLGDGSNSTEWHDDYAAMGMDLDASNSRRAFFVVDNGSTVLTQTSTNLNDRGEAHQYLGILRNNQFFQGWSAGAAGGWMRRGNAAYAGGQIIDSIGIKVGNNTNVDPGSMIQSFDFIRFSEGLNLP